MSEETKRVTIEVPESLHRKIKMIASARECTIRDYIIKHIQKYIHDDMVRMFQQNKEE